MNLKNQCVSYQYAFLLILFSCTWVLTACTQTGQLQSQDRKTKVSIVGEQFFINETPTYEGRAWTASNGEEYNIEGLLMNARLVQGVFDDLNPETRGQWEYPDTKEWDPDRNTQDFIEAMASWREHGLLAYTLNLQGGCPYGYCDEQRWDNSAFAPDGSLREGYMNRVERVIDRADKLGMVVMLGYFYFGQDGNLEDEDAVIRAVENATKWVLEKGYTNVIIEINNECNVRYDDHPILQCERVHELIEFAKNMERDGRSLYVSTSLGGGGVPPANIVEASDFVFLHGNGVSNPEQMVEMIREVREMDVYTPMPIVNNEDDQPWREDAQGWEDDGNNFVASVMNYASWGYFDFRLPDEYQDYNLGFQSVPVNWYVTSDRKQDFFGLLADITGSPGTPTVHLDWSREIGNGTVRVEEENADAPIELIELLINNEVVVSATEAPFEFQLEDVPDGEHWVRARAVYNNGEHEVIIESPWYRNPWWPYGGRY